MSYSKGASARRQYPATASTPRDRQPLKLSQIDGRTLDHGQRRPDRIDGRVATLDDATRPPTPITRCAPIPRCSRARRRHGCAQSVPHHRQPVLDPRRRDRQVRHRLADITAPERRTRDQTHVPTHRGVEHAGGDVAKRSCGETRPTPALLTERTIQSSGPTPGSWAPGASSSSFHHQLSLTSALAH